MNSAPATHLTSTAPLASLDLAKLKPQLLQINKLPLLPYTREAVLQALHHPNASANRVAKACSDPVLQLQLWLKANHMLARRGNQVHQLSHAISLLGLPQVEQWLLHCDALKAGGTDNECYLGYLETLTQSQLAADLASQVYQQQQKQKAKRTDPAELETLTSATLFGRWYEWALWHFQPTYMHNLQPHCLRHNPLLPVGRTISPSLALPKPLQDYWQLPQAQLLDAYAHSLKDDFPQWLDYHPEQAHSFSKPYLTAALCNEVSRQFCLCPSSRVSQRAQRLLARQTGLSMEVIGRCLWQAVLSLEYPVHLSYAIRSHAWPHPAARLLQQWDARQLLNQPSQSSNAFKAAKPNVNSATAISIQSQRPQQPAPIPSIEPSPEAAPVPEQPAHDICRDRPLLQRRLHQLRNQPESIHHLNQLLLLGQECIHQGLGLSQCAIFLVQPKLQRLQCRYHAGFPKDAAVGSLQTPLGNPLLQQLLQRQQTLLVTSDNLKPLQRGLPDALAQQLHPQQTLLGRLLNGKRPLALVYASAAHLQPKHLPLFNTICLTLNQSITYLAKQQRQAKTANR